ncbi:MAG: mechanosensitive ion channel [Mollicutes bacterium]|nr:mechanosensitive ion channel [Mollicutes bacterium]
MEILEKIVEFILSEKFYAPLLFIIIGMIINVFVRLVIAKLSIKANRFGINKKRQTVFHLIYNFIKYMIIIIVFLLILDVYGINTSALVASLGVASVIIGLAFQDTIKNMLAGIFIILDDRYNVDDYVKINEFVGVVLDLGLQTTKVKGDKGEIFTISNSKINTVINYTESDTILIIEIPIQSSTDLNKIDNMLKKIETIVLNIDGVLGNYKVLGLESLKANELFYKISVNCKSSDKFVVKRKIIRLIKDEFVKENIDTPFNQKITKNKGK